jgi:hypothetical protein
MTGSTISYASVCIAGNSARRSDAAQDELKTHSIESGFE